MKLTQKLFGLSALLFLLVLSGCKKDKDDRGINIFSIDDDIMLGEQVQSEIENSDDFIVLPEQQYPVAYGHINRVMDDILATGHIKNKDIFDWRVKIVHNDTILNAFCAPGGYIVFYTGLIKFLDSESDFAGVMGHEMCHADNRHVTDQLTTQYGLSALIGILLGEDPGLITEIAAGLAFLSFSRKKESEADLNSVKYLCDTEWHANGAAGFFQKLIDLGQAGGPPQFLSTHPSPDNRVEAINEEAATFMECVTGNDFDVRYTEFKNSLP